MNTQDPLIDDNLINFPELVAVNNLQLENVARYEISDPLLQTFLRKDSNLRQQIYWAIVATISENERVDSIKAFIAHYIADLNQFRAIAAVVEGNGIDFPISERAVALSQNQNFPLASWEAIKLMHARENTSDAFSQEIKAKIAANIAKNSNVEMLVGLTTSNDTGDVLGGNAHTAVLQITQSNVFTPLQKENIYIIFAANPGATAIYQTVFDAVQDDGDLTEEQRATIYAAFAANPKAKSIHAQVLEYCKNQRNKVLRYQDELEERFISFTQATILEGFLNNPDIDDDILKQVIDFSASGTSDADEELNNYYAPFNFNHDSTDGRSRYKFAAMIESFTQQVRLLSIASAHPKIDEMYSEKINRAFTQIFEKRTPVGTTGPVLVPPLLRLMSMLRSSNDDHPYKPLLPSRWGDMFITFACKAKTTPEVVNAVANLSTKFIQVLYLDDRFDTARYMDEYMLLLWDNFTKSVHGIVDGFLEREDIKEKYAHSLYDFIEPQVLSSTGIGSAINSIVTGDDIRTNLQATCYCQLMMLAAFYRHPLLEESKSQTIESRIKDLLTIINLDPHNNNYPAISNPILRNALVTVCENTALEKLPSLTSSYEGTHPLVVLASVGNREASFGLLNEIFQKFESTCNRTGDGRLPLLEQAIFLVRYSNNPNAEERYPSPSEFGPKGDEETVSEVVDAQNREIAQKISTHVSRILDDININDMPKAEDRSAVLIEAAKIKLTTPDLDKVFSVFDSNSDFTSTQRAQILIAIANNQSTTLPHIVNVLKRLKKLPEKDRIEVMAAKNAQGVPLLQTFLQNGYTEKAKIWMQGILESSFGKEVKQQLFLAKNDAGIPAPVIALQKNHIESAQAWSDVAEKRDFLLGSPELNNPAVKNIKALFNEFNRLTATVYAPDIQASIDATNTELARAKATVMVAAALTALGERRSTNIDVKGKGKATAQDIQSTYNIGNLFGPASPDNSLSRFVGEQLQYAGQPSTQQSEMAVAAPSVVRMLIESLLPPSVEYHEETKMKPSERLDKTQNLFGSLRSKRHDDADDNPRESSAVPSSASHLADMLPQLVPDKFKKTKEVSSTSIEKQQGGMTTLEQSTVTGEMDEVSLTEKPLAGTIPAPEEPTKNLLELPVLPSTPHLINPPLSSSENEPEQMEEIREEQGVSQNDSSRRKLKIPGKRFRNQFKKIIRKTTEIFQKRDDNEGPGPSTGSTTVMRVEINQDTLTRQYRQVLSELMTTKAISSIENGLIEEKAAPASSTQDLVTVRSIDEHLAKEKKFPVMTVPLRDKEGKTERNGMSFLQVFVSKGIPLKEGGAFVILKTDHTKLDSLNLEHLQQPVMIDEEGGLTAGVVPRDHRRVASTQENTEQKQKNKTKPGSPKR